MNFFLVNSNCFKICYHFTNIKYSYECVKDQSLRKCIHETGKGMHYLEESMVFGASKNDSITYENEQEKIRRIIEKLTEEKARELGISRRTLFYWRQKIREGKEIVLKNRLKVLLILKDFQRDYYDKELEIQ